MSSPTAPTHAASAILTSYLTQLRLPTMAASCAAVAREAAASNLDYLAFLTLLCGQEVAQREQTQAARRIAQAQFPWPLSVLERGGSDMDAVHVMRQGTAESDDG